MKKIVSLTLAASLLIVILAAALPVFAEKTELTVGDTLFFGSYEQDNDTVNGDEPIEWIILDVWKDGSLMLISKHGLDGLQYLDGQGVCTWESSTLRAWLNEDFYTAAFDEQEQERILTVDVKADTNVVYKTEQGNDTRDKVFLLSIKEAQKYFHYDGERKCSATEYAIAHYADESVYLTDEGKPTTVWWLRTVGSTPDFASRVYILGDVDYSGNVMQSTAAVRPVIVILP